MAALPYSRSAFSALSAISALSSCSKPSFPLPSTRPSLARRWAVRTGAGLALPLLLAGPAMATGDGPADAPRLGQALTEQTVQQAGVAVQQALARAPAPLPPVAISSAAVLPSLPGTWPPWQSASAAPTPPQPTRSTASPTAKPSQSPSAGPSASATASPSGSPSPPATPSPSATPTSASPSDDPAEESSAADQPGPAPQPPVPAPGDSAPAGDAVQAQPSDAPAEDPAQSTDVPTPSSVGAVAQAPVQVAAPLRLTDATTVKLPLGAGLALIGCGLALVGLRMRRG